MTYIHIVFSLQLFKLLKIEVAKFHSRFNQNRLSQGVYYPSFSAIVTVLKSILLFKYAHNMWDIRLYCRDRMVAGKSQETCCYYDTYKTLSFKKDSDNKLKPVFCL